MKGVNLFRIKGRNLSLTLIVLTVTTVILWSWEKNPLVSTLLAAQYQFTPSSSAKESTDPTESFGASRVNFSISLPVEVDDRDSTKAPSSENAAKETKDTSESFGASTRNSSITSPGKEDDRDLKKPSSSENAVDDTTINSSVPVPVEEDDQDSEKTSSSENTACNYAKGNWVADSRRPLYSGLGCKQWLSAMWSCRLTQRTDFSFEGYRWQPKNCKMPEFERSAFLKRMQDKTIAFIGDSLGRQQFQSLMCMATGGEESPEVQNVGHEYGLVKLRGHVRPDGWAYRFPTTNTTILYYWSASLSDLVPLNESDPATNVSMHLDRPPAFLRTFLPGFDVLVLNTGHHWNRGKLNANRWVMYINGTPVKDKQLLDIGNAKNFTVHSIARWVDSQLPSHPRLKAFFRTISPRHFKNGDWNTGGSCDNTVPLIEGSEVSKDGSSDKIVEGAVKGTKVKILDITALSELRDEGHMSRYSNKKNEGVNDCLHWCLPGVPDTWNELLVAQA